MIMNPIEFMWTPKSPVHPLILDPSFSFRSLPSSSSSLQSFDAFRQSSSFWSLLSLWFVALGMPNQSKYYVLHSALKVEVYPTQYSLNQLLGIELTSLLSNFAILVPLGDQDPEKYSKIWSSRFSFDRPIKHSGNKLSAHESTHPTQEYFCARPFNWMFCFSPTLQIPSKHSSIPLLIKWFVFSGSSFVH